MANKNKLNVSQSRRNEIKENFSSIRKSELTGDEKKYFTLVENGKRSARNNLRLDGRYLGGEIVDIIKKVAERKEMPLQDYLNENREAVHNLIDKGAIEQERRIDATIDSLAAIKRKTIEVDDGNGVTRMKRVDAIEALAKLEQFAASNTTIVGIGLSFKVFKDGHIRVKIPPPEYYENFDADEFEQMLDDLGIFYIKSPKKGSS
jgi:DNA-binding PadR family transcriptional regulator